LTDLMSLLNCSKSRIFGINPSWKNDVVKVLMPSIISSYGGRSFHASAGEAGMNCDPDGDEVLEIEDSCWPARMARIEPFPGGRDFVPCRPLGLLNARSESSSPRTGTVHWMSASRQETQGSFPSSLMHLMRRRLHRRQAFGARTTTRGSAVAAGEDCSIAGMDRSWAAWPVVIKWQAWFR
jgi:hypothetical protein